MTDRQFKDLSVLIVEVIHFLDSIDKKLQIIEAHVIHEHADKHTEGGEE